MNFREELGIYEVRVAALTELLKAARQTVEINLNAKKGLRYIFARRDIQAELQKYDRIATALGNLDLDTIYLEKPLVDNLTKPENLDEPAWLGILAQETQIRILSSEYGHRFQRDPHPETALLLREELNKTPLGRKAVETLDRNAIEIVFAAPLQGNNGYSSRGGYMRESKKLWLAYSELSDMAEIAVHEAAHADQDSRDPEIFKFYSPQALQSYENKVHGYIAARLTEAQAYAAEDLYKAEKRDLYKSDSAERTALLETARTTGFKDTDEDFEKFLHLGYFSKRLQSIPEQESYESKFIDSQVLFYPNTDFARCVVGSPYVTDEFLENFCVNADGDCILPPDPEARKDACYQIIKILCDPIMLRAQRMTCMPAEFRGYRR